MNNIFMYGQGVVQSTRFSDEKKVHFYINDAFSTLGQSFTASKSGKISSISITLEKELLPQRVNNQIYFWVGENPEIGNILEGAPFQKITLPTRVKGNVYTFKLDEPFFVTKGKIYRMQFGYPSKVNSLSYLFSGSIKNPYPDGNVYFHNGMPQYTRDLDFVININ